MDAALFWPAFAQVALVFALGLPMAFLRSRAISTRAVRLGDIALGQQSWPGAVQRISSCYSNQFESPALFLAGVVFAGLLGVHDPLVVGLAWLFIASRLVHALIYVTFNHILYRFLAFIVGFAAIGAIWALLALHVAGLR